MLRLLLVGLAGRSGFAALKVLASNLLGVLMVCAGYAPAKPAGGA